MKLIASMQDPQQQIDILRAIGCGPVNPAADAQVPAELKGQNPSDSTNLGLQVIFDVKWYAENQIKVTQQYMDFLAS
jgi:putative spermidine/putrescine transport system substrate-binding protein